MIVYVHDIVITGNDAQGITDPKQYLVQHFQTKELASLRHFLNIKDGLKGNM